MKTEITINSEKFPAYPNEDRDTNPGRFGKRLGEFIIQVLANHNIATADFYPTDYCYELRIDQFDFKVYIDAGNIDGTEDSFLISIEPKKEFVRKWFKKISTKPVIENIYNILIDVFYKEGIEIVT